MRLREMLTPDESLDLITINQQLKSGKVDIYRRAHLPRDMRRLEGYDVAPYYVRDVARILRQAYKLPISPNTPITVRAVCKYALDGIEVNDGSHAATLGIYSIGHEEFHYHHPEWSEREVRQAEYGTSGDHDQLKGFQGFY